MAKPGMPQSKVMLPALEVGKHILHAQHHMDTESRCCYKMMPEVQTCLRGENVTSQSCLGKAMLEIKLKGF